MTEWKSGLRYTRIRRRNCTFFGYTRVLRVPLRIKEGLCRLLHIYISKYTPSPQCDVRQNHETNSSSFSWSNLLYLSGRFLLKFFRGEKSWKGRIDGLTTVTLSVPFLLFYHHPVLRINRTEENEQHCWSALGWRNLKTCWRKSMS